MNTLTEPNWKDLYESEHRIRMLLEERVSIYIKEIEDLTKLCQDQKETINSTIKMIKDFTEIWKCIIPLVFIAQALAWCGIIKLPIL